MYCCSNEDAEQHKLSVKGSAIYLKLIPGAITLHCRFHLV